MKKALCILTVLAYLSNVFSQNNYPSEYPLYYNFKDTITNQCKASVALPVLQVTDSALQDSLEQYIDTALKKGYGQYEDSNGVFFSIGLTTYEPDTVSIHISINAAANYYLYEYIVSSIDHINKWAPKDHWEYWRGVIPYGKYIILVITTFRLPQEELDEYFKETGDAITLCLFEEVPIRSVGNGIEPGLYYSAPMTNPRNYKSPKWLRKNKPHEQ